MHMGREKIANMEFGNWTGPWVISFSPLVKQMRNLRPTDGNSVILVLILPALLEETSIFSLTGTGNYFFSCLAEVTQCQKKNFKADMSKAC